MNNITRRRGFKKHLSHRREVIADFKGILEALVDNIKPDARVVGTVSRGEFAARLAEAMEKQRQLKEDSRAAKE